MIDSPLSRVNFILFFMFQFTEEKLGQAERTELDAHLENLLAKSESTKHWTEKIMKQTEVILQPNPSKSFNQNTAELLAENCDHVHPDSVSNLLNKILTDFIPIFELK